MSEEYWQGRSATRRGLLAGAGFVGAGGILARYGDATAQHATGGKRASQPPLALAAYTASTTSPLTAPQGLQVGNAAWWIPPSDDSSGATDTANLTSALSNGYEVLLLPGTYYLNPGHVVLGMNQYLHGPGKGMCVINGVASGSDTGPVIQLANSTGNSHQYEYAGIGGVTVSSSALGAGCPALQVGDIVNIAIDDVATFGNADSPGFLARNSAFWTEQLHGTLFAAGGSGSAPAVQFDVEGGTNSFDRPDLTIYLDNGRSNGIEFTNGAVIGWGRLSVRGNSRQPASGTTPPSLLSFSGHTTGTTSTGQTYTMPAGIYRAQLDIQVEFDGSDASVTGPQTISFNDSAGNRGYIEDCYGLIDVHAYGEYASPGWKPSDNVHNFRFHGPVFGDESLLLNIGSPDTNPQNIGILWTGISGWQGWVKYRKMDDADLVFIEWGFTISPNTAIVNGQTIVTLPSPYFYPVSKRLLPGTLFGAVGASEYGAGALLNTGEFVFYGPSFTTSSAGDTYWSGQATISNSM